MEITKVRPVTNDDFESIAIIHKASYGKDHLTSFFPINLLKVYYKSIWDKNSYAFIAINEAGVPVGFVIGGNNLDEPIKKFIRTHKLALALVLLKHPKFILQRIADRLKKASEQKHTSYAFQLLSIAVRQDMLSKCAVLLLGAFERQLRSNNIMQYGLSVRKTNIRAMQFYEKNDFKLEFETVTLRCYYKNLK